MPDTLTPQVPIILDLLAKMERMQHEVEQLRSQLQSEQPAVTVPITAQEERKRKEA